MSEWKDILRRLHGPAFAVEEGFDRLRRRLTRRLGPTRRLHIAPFHGYGTVRALHVIGRVLEDPRIVASDDRDAFWRNLERMYRRFNSAEVPGIDVHASFPGCSQSVKTDDEGYFEVELAPAESVEADRWHDVALAVSDVERGEARAAARVLVASDEASCGVISDVDDTIIHTGATNILRLLQNTFLENARTRVAFDGVAPFYRALQRGLPGTPLNPIFYVSNAPWNLFDFLADFMRIQDIPAGPILLRDFGIDADKFIVDHDHKVRQISRLMNRYPFPFVLIGDSGEKDPEIYREILDRFPGRIKAVYIRDVTSEERHAQVERIASEVRARGVEMLLTPDTLAAAEHASSLGIVDSSAIEEVSSAVASRES